MLPALFSIPGPLHRGELPFEIPGSGHDPAAAHAFSPRRSACSRSPAIRPVGPARRNEQLLTACALQHRVVQASEGAGRAEQLKGRATRSSRGGRCIGLAVTTAYLPRRALQPQSIFRCAIGAGLQALIQAHPTGCTTCGRCREQSSIAAMVAGARQRFGTITVLFNNAAVFDLAPCSSRRAQLPAHLSMST